MYESLAMTAFFEKKPKNEKVSVRYRKRQGGNKLNGTDYTWEEWQVISGRRIFSRHDSEELALTAAQKRLVVLGSR